MLAGTVHDILSDMNKGIESHGDRRSRMCRAIGQHVASMASTQELIDNYVEDHANSLDEYEKQSTIERRFLEAERAGFNGRSP